MSDTRKAPLDLVPLRALIGSARVLAHGNRKTKKDGTPFPTQRKPGDFIERELDGVFFASMLRHSMELQLLNGTVTPESLAVRDHDTDLPTIDHVICNLLIVRTMLIRDGLLPEDPGPGRAAMPKWEAVPDARVRPEHDLLIVRTMWVPSVEKSDEPGPELFRCTADALCKVCRDIRDRGEIRGRLENGPSLKEFDNEDLDNEIAEGFGDTKES